VQESAKNAAAMRTGSASSNLCMLETSFHEHFAFPGLKVETLQQAQGRLWGTQHP
jgi:hypothetical protein